MRINIKEISSIINDNNEFRIFTHKQPDGDAVASAVGLAMILQSMGKKAEVKCCDKFPEKFMPFIEGFKNNALGNPIFIGVDIASIERLGDYSSENVTVCIDHHDSNKCLVDNTYLEADAVSCSLIIYKIFRYMGVDIPPKALELLFAGIITDSLCFQSPATNSEAFSVASEMALAIDTCDIINKVFVNKSKNELTVEQKLLSSMEYYFDNRLVIGYLTNDTINLIGKNNTGGLSSLVMKPNGVVLGITILEKTPGKYNVTFRSAGELDASVLAVAMGGGGHQTAAGTIIETDDVRFVIDTVVHKAETIYNF